MDVEQVAWSATGTQLPAKHCFSKGEKQRDKTEAIKKTTNKQD